jgi:hypothetical protein
MSRFFGGFRMSRPQPAAGECRWKRMAVLKGSQRGWIHADFCR